jgi:hypothetical protein
MDIQCLILSYVSPDEKGDMWEDAQLAKLLRKPHSWSDEVHVPADKHSTLTFTPKVLHMWGDGHPGIIESDEVHLYNFKEWDAIPLSSARTLSLENTQVTRPAPSVTHLISDVAIDYSMFPGLTHLTMYQPPRSDLYIPERIRGLALIGVRMDALTAKYVEELCLRGSTIYEVRTNAWYVDVHNADICVLVAPNMKHMVSSEMTHLDPSIRVEVWSSDYERSENGNVATFPSCPPTFRWQN